MALTASNANAVFESGVILVLLKATTPVDKLSYSKSASKSFTPSAFNPAPTTSLTTNRPLDWVTGIGVITPAQLIPPISITLSEAVAFACRVKVTVSLPKPERLGLLPFKLAQPIP